MLTEKLKPQVITAIIEKKGFDLQLFAEKSPRERIEDFIERQKNWREGDDPRLKIYTKENVDKALFYYRKYLKNGLVAPDGNIIRISEADFYHHIVDPILIRKPGLIREIIKNAQIKIEDRDGRHLYFSLKPSGYVVTGNITYSVHSWGAITKEQFDKKIQRRISKGGKTYGKKLRYHISSRRYYFDSHTWCGISSGSI